MEINYTVMFAGMKFKININSFNQEKIFSMRQLSNFIVPLISLDCRFKSRIIFPDTIKPPISNYILVTPLDIAINGIPENYKKMIGDKMIRTEVRKTPPQPTPTPSETYSPTLESLTPSSVAPFYSESESESVLYPGSDIQLAILCDDIDKNIIKQYQDTNYSFIHSSKISNLGCIHKHPNEPAKLPYRTVIDTFEYVDVEYIKLYLTPCPSNYELKVELEKLLNDKAIVEQRKASGKHDKDKERFITIDNIDKKYPYNPSERKSRNDYLPKLYRDLRNTVEQVYQEDTNVKDQIDRLNKCIKILYSDTREDIGEYKGEKVILETKKNEFYLNNIFGDIKPMVSDVNTLNLLKFKKIIIPTMFKTLGYEYENKQLEEDAVSEVLYYLHAFVKNQKFKTSFNIYFDKNDRIILEEAENIQLRKKSKINQKDSDTYVKWRGIEINVNVEDKDFSEILLSDLEQFLAAAEKAEKEAKSKKRTKKTKKTKTKLKSKSKSKSTKKRKLV